MSNLKIKLKFVKITNLIIVINVDELNSYLLYIIREVIHD